MNSNPDPTLEYYFANAVTNEWLNVEDDEHPLYWVKFNSSLYVLVFNKKVQNQLILYLQGQKCNPSNRIIKLKEPWNFFNLKVIQYIFRPDQLHSCCRFPKEVT